MLIRSRNRLDFPLAWQRTLTWAQSGQTDVRDRLPFELLARLFGETGPSFSAESHHLFPVTLVTGSKKSGTSRPFARISPTDLMLYQALVDQLATAIENALPPRDVVFAYRQTLDGSWDAFAGTPTREQYETRTRDMLESFEHGFGYAITADIAGYFLHIDTDELERQLYMISDDAEIVRDLAALLRAWQTLGVRGLPQGVRPSSPLGNVYLRPIDSILHEQGVRYVRWMDDFIIATPGFHDARRIQDEIEQRLYEYGLSLAADKTRVVRWDVAIKEAEGARTLLDRAKQRHRAQAEAWLAEALRWTDYPPDEDDLPDPAELDREAVLEEYDKLLETLDATELPKRIGSHLVPIFRSLESMKHAHRLDELPTLLMRVPDVTGVALSYLVAVAKHDRAATTDVFATLLSATHFMRDFEKLAVCEAVLHLEQRTALALTDPLGGWALNDPQPLVRVRALLAWGAQSAADDFSVVDRFWPTASAAWRPYVLIAIQGKSRRERDVRLESWGSDGRFLGRVAALVKQGGIGWRKL